jgi:pimeloyl-ACP methyl ester carboxylesterase
LCNLSETKENQKTRIIRDYCVKNKKRMLVADWFGRGGSSGSLMEATLTRWTKDTIDFLDGSLPGSNKNAVFVGSGVGAWVTMLVAKERPDLVGGFVGLSADPDFTEDLLWAQLPEEEKEAIMRDGYREVKWGHRAERYPITSTLIEDGRNNLVLRGGPQSFEISCPVRLIHSLEDEEVPITVPLKIAETVSTMNCEVIMPKVGGHALEDQRQTLPRYVDPSYDQKNGKKTPKLSPFEEALVKSLDECLQPAPDLASEKILNDKSAALFIDMTKK